MRAEKRTEGNRTRSPLQMSDEIPWRLQYASTFACVMGIIFAGSFVGYLIFQPELPVLMTSAVASGVMFGFARMYKMEP